MKKGVLDESRYRWTPQVAGAIAGVLEAAQAAGQSGCLHLVEYTLLLFLLGAPASKQMLRNAVRQAETNTLDERALVQMRVVATRVPARRPVLPVGFVAPHESREAGVARDGTTNGAAVAGRKVSLQFYTHPSTEASKNTGCAGRCAGLLARVPSSGAVAQRRADHWVRRPSGRHPSAVAQRRAQFSHRGTGHGERCRPPAGAFFGRLRRQPARRPAHPVVRPARFLAAFGGSRPEGRRAQCLGAPSVLAHPVFGAPSVWRTQ